MEAIEYKRNVCPVCKSPRIRVYGVVKATITTTIRYHSCHSCGENFKTFESILLCRTDGLTGINGRG
jgi:transcriptional regulator NrdR family protein